MEKNRLISIQAPFIIDYLEEERLQKCEETLFNVVNVFVANVFFIRKTNYFGKTMNIIR